MARSVPLSRSTLRVGGGSAFFVRRQDARMKKYFKIVSIVALTNLLCFWSCYALLDTYWPDTSALMIFVQWASLVFGAPISIFLDNASAHYMSALILCSVLNSIVWGICLAFPIYGVSKRYYHVAA
jgi:hypothetical protein